jgi:hypothetical protein
MKGEDRMATDEEIIVATAPLLQDRLGKGYWLLVFTDLRIIAIRVGSATDAVGFVVIQGLAGPFAPESDIDREIKSISSLSVAEILDLKNDKEIYPHETIASVVVKPSRMAPSISITQRGKKRKVYRGERKVILKVHEQKDRLRMHIPNIT